MPHYQRNIRFIAFVILPILGFLLGWSLSQKNAENQHDYVLENHGNVDIPDTLPKAPKINQIFKKTTPKDVDLDLFWEVWNTVEANFVEPEAIETKTQVYGAIKGLVDSLDDPYTTFFDPEENMDFEESMNGEFQGIGCEIAIRDNSLTVVSPLKGSPAELAGLETDDIIYEIDGEASYGMSIEEAVTLIRGPKGEPVTLTVLRKQERKPLEITIVRDDIVIHDMEWEMQDDVAVISLYQFGTNATKEFKEALNEIVLKSPRGIILDVRGNGGGLLDAAVKIISEFIEDEVVVKTSGRRFGDTGDLKSQKDGSMLDVPLIVLSNGGSASASEILIGAVQDHNRGLVLGTKTFGKGSVQNVIPLSDGSSIKVTVAEWLTPNGRSINEVGLYPDEIIELTDEDFEQDRDPVLGRALDLVGTDEMESILAEPRTWGEEVVSAEEKLEALNLLEESNDVSTEKE